MLVSVIDFYVFDYWIYSGCVRLRPPLVRVLFPIALGFSSTLGRDTEQIRNQKNVLVIEKTIIAIFILKHSHYSAQAS